MNRIFAAARDLQEFCSSRHWRFCFVGGVAVQRWGEPRFTRDVDLTLLTGFGREEEFTELLLAHFKPRRPDARQFALESRVVLLEHEEGTPLDIALGAIPFEERAVQRATPWQVKDKLSLITCSAEDLIVFKAFAARGIDWLDVERIVMRQGPKLRGDQILSELRPLVKVKEEPQILSRLQAIFDQYLGE